MDFPPKPNEDPNQMLSTEETPNQLGFEFLEGEANGACADLTFAQPPIAVGDISSMNENGMAEFVVGSIDNPWTELESNDSDVMDVATNETLDADRIANSADERPSAGVAAMTIADDFNPLTNSATTETLQKSVDDSNAKITANKGDNSRGKPTPSTASTHTNAAATNDSSVVASTAVNTKNIQDQAIASANGSKMASSKLSVLEASKYKALPTGTIQPGQPMKTSFAIQPYASQKSSSPPTIYRPKKRLPSFQPEPALETEDRKPSPINTSKPPPANSLPSAQSTEAHRRARVQVEEDQRAGQQASEALRASVRSAIQEQRLIAKQRNETSMLIPGQSRKARSLQKLPPVGNASPLPKVPHRNRMTITVPARMNKEDTDDTLQPFSKVSGDFYLHDDDILVEEDPLPARAVTSRAATPSKKFSVVVHPIPPKSVGGLQDQVFATALACKCKVPSRKSKGSPRAKTGNTCLKLYCDCFATGSYCNEGCSCSATCFNNAAESNVHLRTQAIVATLTQDPHAFRHTYASMAEQQKEHRVRLVKSEARSAKFRRLNPLKAAAMAVGPKPPPSSVDQINTVEQALDFVALPGKNLKRGSDGDTDDAYVLPNPALTTQLPASYYTMPLKVNGGSTLLTGLSFSLTHPRHRKRKQRFPAKKRNSRSGSKKVPPAASGAAQFTGQDKQISKTRLETIWATERQKVGIFYKTMMAELKGSKHTTPESHTGQQALAMLESVNEDMQNMKTIVLAAKNDMMTRFYQERRRKRGSFEGVQASGSSGGQDSSTQDDALEIFLTDETLAPLPSDQQHVGSESNFKELAILAAQDTALLQETARIVRSQARELAERRMQKEESSAKIAFV